VLGVRSTLPQHTSDWRVISAVCVGRGRGFCLCVYVHLAVCACLVYNGSCVCVCVCVCVREKAAPSGQPTEALPTEGPSMAWLLSCAVGIKGEGKSGE